MADGGLLLIYRSMPTEKLLELQETMWDQMTALGDYTSMSAGGKSWTRDFRQLQSQLEALTFVLNERGSGGKVGYDAAGVVDFNCHSVGRPYGTSENLNY